MGVLHEYISQHYPPASKYTENDVPDLAGKVMLVTGGNAGIGSITSILPFSLSYLLRRKGDCSSENRQVALTRLSLMPLLRLSSLMERRYTLGVVHRSVPMQLSRNLRSSRGRTIFISCNWILPTLHQSSMPLKNSCGSKILII